jgi:transcriptional regulator with XRE-family HTH domain
MTQLELAEKLCYSDKSISKWERGEGLPDLPVAVKIAEVFGVSVNDLIGEKMPRKFLISRNRVLITLMSTVLVWLVAAIMYFVFKLIAPAWNSEMLFAYAVPTSFLVMVVFTNIWWKKIWRFLSLTAFIWSFSICIVCSIPVAEVTLLYISTAVIQVLVILWYLMKRVK